MPSNANPADDVSNNSVMRSYLEDILSMPSNPQIQPSIPPDNRYSLVRGERFMVTKATFNRP